MTIKAEAGRPRRMPRRVVLMLVLAVGVGAVTVAPYVMLDPAASRIELRESVPLLWSLLLLHIFTACVALTAGPLQFLPALRLRPRVHRSLGRVYLGLGVLPSAVVVLILAVLSTSGLTPQVGLFVPGVLWLVTGWFAYRAARGRRFAEHREWMIRNYAITFLAVTSRMWVPVLMLVQLPVLRSAYGGDAAAMVEASIPVGQWMGWVGNLIAAEIIINRTRGRRSLPAGRQEPGPDVATALAGKIP